MGTQSRRLNRLENGAFSMKVRLNLATSPMESNRRFIVGAGIVGTLGVIAMVVLAWNSYSVWRSNTALRVEETRVENEMGQLRDQRRDLEAFFNRPQTTLQLNQAAFLNGLIAQRTFPWTKIFMDLERSLPDGVRVVSIEPQLAGDHVQLRLTIGASSDDAKLRFLRALESSPAFSQIEVLSEGQPTQSSGGDHVLLSLVAHYSVT
jgi:Tfp pilus assembly protein PilN